MIDFTIPMRACLVSPEGTACVPLQWGGNELCEFRFVLVEMTDEEEHPIPQPVETLGEYTGAPVPGMWTIDLRHLPGGWDVIALDSAGWQTIQNEAHKHRFDKDDMIWKREGIATQADEVDVTISSWVRGGLPAYRIRGQSAKSERDFPNLLFTHVPEKRKDPISPAERFGAAMQNAAVVALARNRSNKM